jgi:uncharacterized protein involved in exopolysaccharide biosynthesis
MNFTKMADDKMNNNQNEEISLKEIINFLDANKLGILITILTFTIIGIIYAVTAPEMFSTKTIFVTKTGTQNSSSISNLATMAGLSLSTNSNNVDPSEYLDKVIFDKAFLLDILNKQWNYNGKVVFIDQIWKLPNDTTVKNSEYIYEMSKINYIRNNKVLNVTKDRKTGILTLVVNFSDPQLAYDINKFVILKLSEYLRNSIKSQAIEKRVFIETRIKEVKADLETSENKLLNFKERNVITSSPKIVLEAMRLNRDVTLNQEIYIQYQKQYELASIEEKDIQTLVQVIQSPEIPISRSKPNRKIIVLIFFTIGSFVGCLGSLFFRVGAESLKIE